jgi:imidazolonepropionase-like amidohydrolase
MRIFSYLLLLPVLAAQPATIAIRGARVVDGTGAPARDAIVLIRDSRIEAVGPDVAIPPDARIVDATGQTLIPGLFDLHTHLSSSPVTSLAADWGKNLKAYLAAGVTTVDDFAIYGEMIAPMHKLMASGAVQAPRVNLAVRISTPAGHGTEGGQREMYTLIASTPEEAHAAMKTALAYKPDVIKIFTDGWRYGTEPDLTSMNLETLAALVEDAHAAGIKVLTHTVTLRGAKIAARAGVDVIAHGIGDAAVDDELIAILKQNKTTYVPTLAVYERKTSAHSQRATPLLEADAREIVSKGPRSSISSETQNARARRWQFLMGSVKRLHEAGIPVGVGTDAGMPGTYHGCSTWRELELLVEAGFTPLDAIAAATGISARALGVDRDRGTIAAGRLADLVLLRGNPDQRIEDIEKTARVFLGGVELDPRALESAIQAKGLTPLPVHQVPAAIDDMERADGRTLLDTLRMYTTDPGTDHSQALFMPVVRGGADHSLMIEAKMAAKPHPYARLEIPLTPGGVELADLSRYHALSFDARGQGKFRLLFNNYGTRRHDPAAAEFQVSGAWQTVRIPLPKVPEWNPSDVRAIFFELAGPAGASVWLDLDNVKFE